MEQYGPLAPIVAYAGYMTAGTLAIRVAWAGKLIWEPDIRDVAKAPARLAGVLSAVAIVLLFAYSRTSNDWKWMTIYLLWFTGIGLFGLLAYIVLLAAYTVQCADEKERTVAGFWLTPFAANCLAQEVQAGRPPVSLRELFCSSRDHPERIWPPIAQGLARAVLVVTYIAFISPTTLAIATGAIILDKAVHETPTRAIFDVHRVADFTQSSCQNGRRIDIAAFSDTWTLIDGRSDKPFRATAEQFPGQQVTLFDLSYSDAEARGPTQQTFDGNSTRLQWNIPLKDGRVVRLLWKLTNMHGNDHEGLEFVNLGVIRNIDVEYKVPSGVSVQPTPDQFTPSVAAEKCVPTAPGHIRCTELNTTDQITLGWNWTMWQNCPKAPAG
jgi:hypothetical protein